MFTIALTGGIASGKSEVERRFAARGIEIIDADLVSREMVAPGTSGFTEVVAAFGTGILAADGTLDRRKLRQQVFADPDARHRIEAIIHPRVRQAMRERAGAVNSIYAMLVIPLLAESGDYLWVDRVLVVDVTRETQIARLIARDDITATLAASMLDAQATREERLAVADDVIDNSGDLDALDAAVERLHRKYLALAG